MGIRGAMQKRRNGPPPKGVQSRGIVKKSVDRSKSRGATKRSQAWLEAKIKEEKAEAARKKPAMSEDEDDDEDEPESDIDFETYMAREEAAEEKKKAAAVAGKATPGKGKVPVSDQEDEPASEEEDAASGEEDEASGEKETAGGEESEPEDDQDEEAEEEEEKAKPKKSKALTKEEKAQRNLQATANTIFVGNLPTNLDQHGVAKLFKCCGPIASARIRSIVPDKEKLAPKVALITGRMHPKVNSVNAYVVFKSNENDECIKKALKMNGQVIDGHHIRVDRAGMPKAKKETKTSRKKSVFVGNLRFDIRNDELIDHFSKVGSVDYVRLVRDSSTGMGKGFGFVVFDERASVKKALELNETQFKGRSLRVKKVDDDTKPKKNKNNNNNNITKPTDKDDRSNNYNKNNRPMKHHQKNNNFNRKKR